jgi:hypothetical protein
MTPDKSALDVGAVAISLGTLFEYLPAIASLLSVVWLLLRIWESDTVQRIIGRR